MFGSEETVTRIRDAREHTHVSDSRVGPIPLHCLGFLSICQHGPFHIALGILFVRRTSSMFCAWPRIPVDSCETGIVCRTREGAGIRGSDSSTRPFGILFVLRTRSIFLCPFASSRRRPLLDTACAVLLQKSETWFRAPTIASERVCATAPEIPPWSPVRIGLRCPPRRAQTVSRLDHQTSFRSALGLFPRLAPPLSLSSLPSTPHSPPLRSRP